jgi:hypothetical protein
LFGKLYALAQAAAADFEAFRSAVGDNHRSGPAPRPDGQFPGQCA